MTRSAGGPAADMDGFAPPLSGESRPGLGLRALHSPIFVFGAAHQRLVVPAPVDQEGAG